MEFTKLFEQKYLPLLRYLYEKEPEEFLFQLDSVSEKGQSFLARMVSHRYHTIEAEAVDFLLEHEYNFFKKITLPSGQTSMDFLALSRHLTDSQLLKIMEHATSKHPDLLQDLANMGVMYWLFDNGYYQSTEYMLRSGIDPYLSTNSGKSLKDISTKSPDTLMKYNEWKEKYFPENENEQKASFKEFLSWLGLEASRSFQSGGYDYSQLLKILEERFVKFSQEQQEDVISHVARFKMLPILNKAIKLTGNKSTTYNPEYVPLWARLALVKNQKVFHLIAEDTNVIKASYFDNLAQEKRSFIYELVRYLGFNHVPQYAQPGSYGSLKGRSGAENMKNYGIQKRVLELLNYDFLSSINPEDNNNTWFISICKNQNLFNTLHPYMGSVFSETFLCLQESNKQKLTSEQVDENQALQDALNNTWFSKDENGKYALEYFMEHSYYMEIHKFFLLKEEFILNDIDKPIYTTHQKEVFLNTFLKSMNSLNYHAKYITSLFKNIEQDDSFNWKNIHYDPESFSLEQKEEYNKNGFITRIETMMMKVSLDEKLTNNIKHSPGVKRKI